MPLGRAPTMGDLFAVSPGRSGSEGDRSLWNRMAHELSHVALPVDEVALRALLEHRIVAITGVDLGAIGPGGAQIDPDWWRLVALPSLERRFFGFGGERRKPDL